MKFFGAYPGLLDLNDAWRYNTNDAIITVGKILNLSYKMII